MTTTKKLGWALATLTVLCLGAGSAWAVDPDHSNDSDMIRIRITPNADYGVEIDTTNVQGTSDGVIDMGALNLYASTYTVRPATVTIKGTVAANGVNGGQELDVNAAITGGWTFDTAPTTDQTGGSVDALAMYLLFSANTLSAAPTASEFADGTANASITSAALTYRAGGASGNGSKFEQQGGGTTNMDNMSTGNVRHMWTYFRLPPTTSVGTQQEITVTLTATGLSL